MRYRLLTTLLALFTATAAHTQTYTQMQWGLNKGVTPYAFGANINGTWRDLGTVTPAGKWTINSENTWVSVDAFGAAGDGVTNDAVALTTAMSSLGSKGGVVFLSCKKDYAILSNVNVPNNVTIVHCQYPYEYGFAGTGTLDGASLLMAHVNLASTASFTMNGNSGYYGAVFRAGQNYPTASISGYSGTAFKSAAGAIQDVRINALVVGFAICYNGTNRVDRLQLMMECDANPSASSGAIIIGPSADTSRIKVRTWPWGTYSATGAVLTRTGYGLQVSGVQDNTHIDVLDYGHTYGVVTAANGNIHWEHVWTDNNTQYGFLANAGDRSDITAMWLYNSKGARFAANGTWGIGYYLCDSGSVASAECLETGAGVAPIINIGALQVAKANLYAINIGTTTAQVNIGSADFKNVNGGVGPYIVGASGWTTDQIQFANTPKTDLDNGNSLLGGYSISPPSISSATTLALPVNANNFYVTGTTSITNITGTYGGRIVELTFRDALTLTNSATIALANGADFVTATGSSIALQFDQVSNVWRELRRSPSSAAALRNGTTGTAGMPVVLQDRPTITNAFTIQGNASPANIIYNTSAATNEKYWDFIATGTTPGTGTLTFRMLQDGYVSALPWLTVTRTGTTPLLAAFAAPISTSSVSVGTAGSVLGTLVFSNTTSGTITLQPTTGVLGTVTATLPANTGTIAETNLAQTFSAAQTFSSGFGVANTAVSGTAPTISSGFGTSPSVTASNGTAAFRVNVGTGGTASSGVIGLPTAANGWNCFASDITTPATGHAIKQTATSTTSVTLTNYNSSGVATAWTASDIIIVNCIGY